MNSVCDGIWVSTLSLAFASLPTTSNVNLSRRSPSREWKLDVALVTLKEFEEMVRKDFASIGPYSPDYEVDLPPSRFSSPPSAALVPFHRVNSAIRPPPNAPIAPLFSGDGTLMVTSTFGVAPTSEHATGELTHSRSSSVTDQPKDATSLSTLGTVAESALLSLPIKPGLAPAATSDKLGLKPLDFPLQTRLDTMNPNCITPPQDSLPAFPQELHFSDYIPELDETCDGIAFAVGRPSQATLDMIQEGLDRIHADLADLAACSKQPPQQIVDRFVKQYGRLNPSNDWNQYQKYYRHFTEQEVDRLRKSGTFSGKIDDTARKFHGRTNIVF